MLAAAYEAPLGGTGGQPGARTTRSSALCGGRAPTRLVADGRLREGRDGRYLPRAPGFPAGEISLRSASLDSVAVVDVSSGEMLGQVEAERAFSTVHPGAIYLHLGRSYEVRELDVDGRRALVEQFNGDWYTQPKKETMVFIEAIAEQRSLGGMAELHFGDVSVTEQVIAYQRKALADHSVIDLVALDLPEQNFPTQALWYALDDRIGGPAALGADVQLGALHAAEHSQIAVLPLLAMCDRWDIGGLSTNIHFQTGQPTIFIYDGHPGGVGIARRGFDEFSRLVADASRLVGRVPLRRGLPLVRAEPEVRQPQRAAAQGRLARADGRDHQPDRGRTVSRPRQIAVIGPRDASDGRARARRRGREPARRGGRHRGLRRARRRHGGGRARGERSLGAT